MSGYVCMTLLGKQQLLFVDIAGEKVRNIGTFNNLWGDFGGNEVLNCAPYSQSTFFSVALYRLLLLCNTNSGNYPVLLGGTYNGVWQTGDLNVAWKDLTPQSAGKGVLQLIQGFDSRFDPNIQAACVEVGLTGDETKVILMCPEGNQNSFGWIVVFDPQVSACGAGACPVAALQLHTAANCRWCGIHSDNAVEGNGDFITAEPAASQAQDSGSAGDGPYETHITSGMLGATPQFAAGQTIPGFNNLVCTPGSLGCDVVTLSGQPCDPTPSKWEAGNCSQPGFGNWCQPPMTIQVGDHMLPVDPNCGNSCELLGVIGVNGVTIAVQRAIPNTCLNCNAVQNHSGINLLMMMCSTNGVGDTAVWKFTADPHGTGLGIIVDTPDELSHGTYGANVGAGSLDWYNCPSGTDCVGIKVGPNVSYAGQMPKVVVPGFPMFNGLSTVGGAYTENYIAAPPGKPTVSNPNFLPQARPIEVSASTRTPVESSIYEVGGNIGGYDPKRSAVVASCGGSPMLEVSGAAAAQSGPIQALNAPYTFCYALRPGECHSGSTPGQFFANCPTGVGSSDQTYVALASATTAKVSLLRFDGWTGNMPVQPVTSSFRPFSRFSSYWSGRSLPSGTGLLTFSDLVPGLDSSSIFIVKMPPLADWDGIERTAFIPVGVTIPATSFRAVTALVKFGYAENGSPNDYFCTRRQEVCYANNPVVNVSNPFFWNSEAPRGTLCAGGCTIQVPAISGRVLYFQIEYRNLSNGVVGTSQPSAVAVP